MTQTRSGHSARREATRQAIIDATLRLIADRGFAATSVEGIALEAGIAKGSVYYNFDSKSDIVAAAMERGLSRLQLMLDEVRAGLQGADALRALISGLLTQISAHPEFAKVMAAEVFRVGREWQESVGTIRATIIASFQRALEEEGPGTDMSVVAASVFGAVLVGGLEWLVFQPGRSFDDVLHSVYEAVGLATPMPYNGREGE